ncbi:MAG: ABC transporter permease [Parvularculaceae bacterium]
MARDGDSIGGFEKADGAAPAMQAPRAVPGYGVRRFGAVNWLGLATLYRREVRRFLKVSFQTVLAPVVSSLLFLIVFKFAIGDGRPPVGGVPYLAFLAPGLVMMAMLNNAFANSSSSILISKVQGAIVDTLMPPLSPSELAAGYVAGAATRGVVVGAATALAMIPFMIAEPFDRNLQIWAILYFSLGASVMLGAVGVLAGIWSEKFDQLAAISNFLITPMAFLSGSFYSIRELHAQGRLPEIIYDISQWNPFFYMIDGFRYGFTGASDAPVWRAAAVVFGLNIALLAACQRLIKSGYKLKA